MSQRSKVKMKCDRILPKLTRTSDRQMDGPLTMTVECGGEATGLKPAGLCGKYPIAMRRAVPPQAPTSTAVATRILYHSSAAPVKRFDSADFELQKFKAAKLARAAELRTETELQMSSTKSSKLVSDDKLERPPPIQMQRMEERLAALSPTRHSPAARACSPACSSPCASPCVGRRC
jgi:hypothetical protein